MNIRIPKQFSSPQPTGRASHAHPTRMFDFGRETHAPLTSRQSAPSLGYGTNISLAKIGATASSKASPTNKNHTPNYEIENRH
jgi:hypothetical protein